MDVQETIRTLVGIEEVAGDLLLIQGLGLQQFSGALMGRCVSGHESDEDRCFGIVPSGNYFYCTQCGIAGDVIDLVSLRLEMSFPAALAWLAEKYCPDLQKKIGEEEGGTDREPREFYLKAELFRKVVEWGRGLLFAPAEKALWGIKKDVQGAAELEYLTQVRRYTARKLRQTEWFYLPGEVEVREYLSKIHPELKSLVEDTVWFNLQGRHGDIFRLAFPFRDKRGVIRGIVKRASLPEGNDVKTTGGKDLGRVRYESVFHTEGLEDQDLFNFHRCKGKREVLMVEGYPDAMYLPTMGIDGVVAVGKGDLLERHVDELRIVGVEKVVISFHNGEDGAGKMKAERAARLLNEKDMLVFSIDPALLSPHRDPDMYIAREGAEAFRTLMEKAEPQGVGDGGTIFRDEDGDILAAGEEAKGKVGDPGGQKDVRRGDEAETAANKSDELSRESIDEEKQGDHKKEMDEMGGKEKLAQATGDIDRKGESPTGKGSAEEVQRGHMTPFQQYLAKKRQMEKERGHALSEFGGIEQDTGRIRPGVYLIGGDESPWGMALLSNLTLDLLNSNEELHAIFLSLKESKDLVIDKFLALLGGVSMEQVKARNWEVADRIDRSYDELIELSGRNRFTIFDHTEVPGIDTLQQQIERYAGSELVVAIDGLDNLKWDETGKAESDGTVDGENRLKALAEIYSLSIFATGELARPYGAGDKDGEPSVEEMMKTPIFGERADLLWLLHSAHPGDYENQEDPTLVLKYVKNRISGFTGKRELVFSKGTGRLGELTGQDGKGNTREKAIP